MTANTFFQKPNSQLATWRHPSCNDHEDWSRSSYDQIDYILVQRRWRNTVTHCYSDTSVPIKADHFPFIAEVKIKLRATERYNKHAPEHYIEATELEKEVFNKTLQDTVSSTAQITHTSFTKAIN